MFEEFASPFAIPIEFDLAAMLFTPETPNVFEDSNASPSPPSAEWWVETFLGELSL